MRRKLLLLPSLLCFASNAAGTVRPMRPGDETYVKIEGQIAEAKKFDHLVEARDQDLKEAEAELTEAAGSHDRARIAKAQEKVANAGRLLEMTKADRVAAYNKAIWLAIVRLDILQPNQDYLPMGKMWRDAPNKGHDVTWLPTFEDKSQVKEFVDEKGAKTSPADLKGVLGMTNADGRSLIFSDAFDNPSLLASSLAHELVHFQQNTTPERAKLGTAEQEIEAYKAERQLGAEVL